MGGVTSGPGVSCVSDAVLLARAFLSRVAEPASIPVWGFVRDVGAVAAVAAIRDGSAPERVVRATQPRRDRIDPHADLEAAERHGLRLVVPESDEWPHFAFAALEHAGAARYRRFDRGETSISESGEPMPPLALWVAGVGDLATLGVRSVGIVGARAATAYGEHVTADLGYGLARRGLVVVSGGAYGIDAAAHRSALAAEGQTVVVSAGGLDRPYPPGNASLFDRSRETGLLVSESPPGAAPQRHRFLTRNRLIAALSTGTVVVEAAVRSGAANTAGHCFALGRPVMAVPGPVTSPMSAGCHVLLRRDPGPALLVTSVADVLAVVGAIGEAGETSPPGAVPDVRAELDALDPVARRVFDGMPARRPARPDEIAQRSGVSPIEVIRSLPVLDLAGLIEASDAGYRIAARLRTPRSRSG
ncbi:MAG: processing protein [Pseudonocardiales bacterium]|nr:processing protein [Pseudonocardiales bacterium]